MSESSPPSDPPLEIQIPLSKFVRFVRQLSHDLRNHLNAAELQSAYIGEIAEDPELKDEVKRLRSMVSATGGALQELTGMLAAVKLTVMPYGAADFIEDLRQKLTSIFPAEAAGVDWVVNLPASATLEIDPQLLQPALIEFFGNAFRHGGGVGQIAVTTSVENQKFVFALREPKSAPVSHPENWGRELLVNVGHGHYGLGLYRARTIVEAHGGQMEVQFDAGGAALVTTVRLPLSGDAA